LISSASPFAYSGRDLSGKVSIVRWAHESAASERRSFYLGRARVSESAVGELSQLSELSQLEVSDLQASLHLPGSSEDTGSSSLLPLNGSEASLETSAIPSAWLIGGESCIRSRFLGKTQDGLAYAVFWECGASHFNWHYNEDEFIVILSGGVFVTDEHGRERHYGPSDFVYFSAGSQANWRVPDHIKKIAILKSAVHQPAAFLLRAWNKLVKIAGLSPNAASKRDVIARHSQHT
jgi:uncharacterized cupin superfamily protein